MAGNKLTRVSAAKLKENILEELNKAIAPGNMTLEEAIEFVEDVASDVETCLDGLREDLRNE